MVIEGERFRSIKVRMEYLKAVSLHSYDWKSFLDGLREKQLTLLEIAERVFGERRSNALEKAIWTMFEMALEKDMKLVGTYIESHIRRCFSEYWIHRYAYFEYHGFNMKKGGFLRNKFDKGLDMFEPDMRAQIKHALYLGKNDHTLPLRVYPKDRYHAQINYMNERWKKITLDFHRSFHLHKDISLSLKMIHNIERTLKKKGSLKTIAKHFMVGDSTPIMYALVSHFDIFVDSLKRILRSQMLSNEEISLSKALQIHIAQETNLLHKLKKHDRITYDKLIALPAKYTALQVKLHNVLNKIQASKMAATFYFGYVKNGKWQSFVIELDSLVKDSVGNDLKAYALHRAKQNKGGSPVQKAVEFFKYVKSTSKHFNVSATGITESDASKWLNMFKKPQTVRSAKGQLSSFYKYLANKKTFEGKGDAEALTRIQKIIAKDFSVKGNEAENPTLPLPEEVYLSIRSHINEVEPEIKHAFLIISATGCRPSELAYLEANSLYYDKKIGCTVLRIYLKKQEKAYSKKGKNAVRKVPIYDDDVIQAFHDQVSLSQETRSASGSSAIFIRRNRNYAHQIKYHVPATKELLKEINALVEKYQIKAELDNDFWNYTPYQMRSMLATAMVEKGHAPEEIKSFFGWMTIHTPEKAYAYVREKKIEELNSDLFKKHFKVSLDEEKLRTYTRAEKEQLFVELYVHKRKMEYGECVRHPIMGECGKLQAVESCASCARMITDVPYLNTWIKFRDNQKEILNTMTAYLDAEGVSKEEYSSWVEYVIQKHRLDSYQSLVDELTAEKERRCQH